jgi:hypothetical protein
MAARAHPGLAIAFLAVFRPAGATLRWRRSIETGAYGQPKESYRAAMSPDSGLGSLGRTQMQKSMVGARRPSRWMSSQHVVRSRSSPAGCYVSTRGQTTTYRQVIDATILGVRIDFEEMGIEQNVLEALQQVP